MTPFQEKLTQDLTFWKIQLGLQAWEIKLVVARQWEMPVQATGCCSRALPLLQATLHILDEIDHGSSQFPVDAEVTLVHELLHIFHFTSGEDGSAKELMEEQGVELTARALVRLRRGIVTA